MAQVLRSTCVVSPKGMRAATVRVEDGRMTAVRFGFAIKTSIAIGAGRPSPTCVRGGYSLPTFGQENPNLIFVPLDEPHGYIEATIER